MIDLIKVMVIGRLTKDPVIRSTPTGKKVASLSVAITMSKNKDTGEQKTEFIDCVAWDALADIIEKYVFKGTQVYLEGYFQTRSWDGTDGKKNYKTEIVVKEMKILTSKASATPAPTPTTWDHVAPPDQLEDMPDINLSELETPF